MTKTLQALNASNSPPASSAGTATPGARVPAYQLPPAQARLSKVPVHSACMQDCVDAACIRLSC